MAMKVSENGLALIKKSEGLRLKAYLDIAGVPTIGYGHTEGVKMGQTITQEKADEFFAADVKMFGHDVNILLSEQPNQNEFDAMVSLAYNIGMGAFETSSVRRHFNNGDFADAALSFALFNKARNPDTNQLEVSDGLTNRRQVETDLFETETERSELIDPLDQQVQAVMEDPTEGTDPSAFPSFGSLPSAR